MATIFENRLEKLRQSFTEMGVDVSEQIYQSTKSYIDHDVKLAQTVIDGDSDVNSNETKLEKQAMNLIALQQPVASDFRIIISYLKAASDLERIGDNAGTIARETLRAKGNPRIADVETVIAKITKHVRKMLEQILDAYTTLDATIAPEIAQEDRKIDHYYQTTRTAITEGILANPETAVAASSYLMVIRLLERIGDHIVNLAEYLIYCETGKIVELDADDGHLD
ncbi:Phosphate transport system regulatory protein PhoU [Fructilactobacillus florum 8D]|uniref:Phosphate-specific transport system accessory protein PhoU n=2 Tax=Fructilactobacillus florum TaxID=640331 RepID=W9EIA8_9LACO|nr:phosphate signaling complex protein PhoU [Fructilactobacillus florum]EKK20434.1 Phosphate transport system regulatory protein PhoU [Fructilactobacillus florum 2F]ETO40745.1 Phosphate transport system regulatory protein PhoU [Fructilactobacillus florum 8D]KRM92366.1 phosphate transport system regulatory protein PhoU [Fructilactobacillus florum DSM 22689 = JCM 16035]